jgi:hypothetical protein
MKSLLLALAVTLVWVATAPAASAAHYGSMAGADLGIDASLKGAVPFPANNAWNQDISKAPVDPNSGNLIAAIGQTTGLHPDFGSGTYDGAIIGIPYVVVAAGQARLPIDFTQYGDESDPGPYPIPPGVWIEGQRPAGGAFYGDRHVLVIDRDANRLYEMWDAFRRQDVAVNGWNAGSGAVFDLASNLVRPGGKPCWTSADAAGLPIFPGLVRYDEASTGVIPHALRFTVNASRRAFVPPANHWVSTSTNVNLPPMGMRVRLKASFPIPASFSVESRAILQALKTYGMMVADNGSSWFISGAPDNRWNNDALVGELRQISGAQFEVVKMTGLVVPGGVCGS